MPSVTGITIVFEHLHTAASIAVPRVNAAPAGYAISAGARAALAKGPFTNEVS